MSVYIYIMYEVVFLVIFWDWQLLVTYYCLVFMCPVLSL